MKKSTIIFLLALGLIAASVFPGCHSILKRGKKRPPGEIASVTTSIRFFGYKQSVDVKTTPKKFLRFLSDSDSKGAKEVFPKYAAFDKIPVAEDGSILLGGFFPGRFERMGITVQGTCVVIKSEETKLWILLDSDVGMLLLKFEMEATGEGMILNFIAVTETNIQGSRFTSPETMRKLVAEETLQSIDEMLAKIQVHYDPSLDTKKLLSHGLRGEIYEAFLQSHRVTTLVNGNPDQIEKLLSDKQMFSKVFGEFVFDEKYLTMYQNLPLDSVGYIPAVFKRGPAEIKIDLFPRKMMRGNTHIMRVYMAAGKEMGVAETELKPDRGESILTLSMKNEIPSGDIAGRLEELMLLTLIPKILEDKVQAIKGVMEAGN